MTEGKARRHKAIADLIRSRTIGSQEELTELLSAWGHSVTQATISRDLEELGAIKVRRRGSVGYALPEDISPSSWSERRLAGILREWVRSIEPAGNLIVIRTPPGSAHLVGVALDQAELPGVAGTISGDDTLFVAMRDASEAVALAARLKDLEPQTA